MVDKFTDIFTNNRVQNDLQVTVNDRLAEIQAAVVEENWNVFKSIVYPKRNLALQ